MPSDTVYTLEEVSRHNTRNDAWLVVHNKVLDVTKFISTHPGGDIILLGAGLDATILFESYHVETVNDAIVKKYQIGVLAPLSGKAKVEDESLVAGSYYNWEGDFYPTLRKRVVARLKELGRSRRGGVLLKAITILTSFFVTYYFAFLYPFTQDQLWIVFLCALGYGVAAAQIGLSIQHDGNHGAFSKSSWINKVAGMGMDLIGASAICWEFQHVIGHHQYTNLSTPTERVMEMREDKKPSASESDLELKFSQENDPDVFSSFPLIRMHPYDERRFYHKYQHIYGPVLFAFFTLSKVIMMDIKFYLLGRVSHISMESRLNSFPERFRFIFFKVANITATIIAPTILYGWQRTAVALLVSHMVAGEYLATCFIVNHIGELCDFYTGGAVVGVQDADLCQVKPKHEKVHPRDWAYLQAKATTNWAVESHFWNTFSGGLNHQLEHHLFPGICHANYPYIAPIVRDTCKEFNVPYIETGSLGQAIGHCLSYLKKLGNEDVVPTPSAAKKLN